MKILSLDTAMAACSAAVVDTEAPLPLAAACVAMERGHAEALPPMVAEVLAASGLAMSQIDRIAVTVGPGTFTGLRIGLAFARGLGLARGIPVIGIDSLSAIAANEDARSPLLIVSDARNDEVYCALFDASRQLTIAPHVTTAAAAVRDVPGGTVVLGTAAHAAIAAGARTDLAVSPAGNLPVAARFAVLARDASPLGMPAPLYLRAPDARPQSVPLRQFSALNMEPVGPAAAQLLAILHGEIFEDGWNARSLGELLATPGTQASLAREADEPLGFIITRRAADEAEIITIGSRPSVQRRGVARQLLEHHIAKLSTGGVRHLFLEVAASNIAAQGLYLASGFVAAGRRKGYYRRRDGVEDAIIMRRELRA